MTKKTDAKKMDAKKMDARTIIAAAKWDPYKNILWAVLEDGKLYSEREVEALIKAELGHKVVPRYANAGLLSSFM